MLHVRHPSVGRHPGSWRDSLLAQMARRSRFVPPDVAKYPALRFFPARTLEQARGAALPLLGGPPACVCCPDVLGHVRCRIGSTLFLDDDPQQLWSMFPVLERERFSPELLAACILVVGRERTRPM